MGNMEINKLLFVFKGKKVLVTGDTGFKGSWLSFWLNHIGADVMGYSLPPKEELCAYNLLNLSKTIKHVDGDIRDLKHMKAEIQKFSPEFIFHLAAQAIVRDSYDDPKYTYETNVIGSVNLLETIRETPSVRSVIYVTSDKCYKNKEWIWGYRESDELGGHDPYSSSKACAELVFSSYFDSFFSKQISKIGIASVRAGNVIGGGDFSKDRIVPDCIKSLKEKKSIMVRNPKATRPWQHVLEPLGGYLVLASNLYNAPSEFSGTSWNFGPNTSSTKTVGDLAKAIIKRWGSGDICTPQNIDQPHEAGLLQVNCDKAKLLIDWNPKWNFDKTIFETVDWYKFVVDGGNATEITNRQIKEYTEEN